MIVKLWLWYEIRGHGHVLGHQLRGTTGALCGFPGYHQHIVWGMLCVRMLQCRELHVAGSE